MDAAEWVIRNMTDQIDAFKGVAQNITARLAALREAERDAVEQASAVMRKARAVGVRTLPPLTVVERGREETGT